MNDILVRTLAGNVMHFANDGNLLESSYISGLTTEGADTLAIGQGGYWGSDLYTYSNGELLRFNQKLESTVIASGFDSFPRDISFGPDGAMYLSMFEEDRILRIAPEPTALGMATVGVVCLLNRSQRNPPQRGVWPPCTS